MRATPNPNQEDTNAVAEQLKEFNAGCPHYLVNNLPTGCPANADPPTTFGDYATWWHKIFVGDVCDAVASTQGSVATEMSFQNGDTAACIAVTSFTMGSLKFGNTGKTCPTHVHSVVQFDSWIGNNTGNASSGIGDTQPTFCECPTPNDLDNCRFNFGCTLANDGTFIGEPGNPASKWQPMSEYSNGPQPSFTEKLTSYQEHLPSSPSASVRTNWDYPADIRAGRFTGTDGTCGFNWAVVPDCISLRSLNGVLWSHVTGFDGLSGANAYSPDRDGLHHLHHLVKDLNNHYTGLTVQELPTFTNGGNVPVAGPIFHFGLWVDGPVDPWLAPTIPWVFALQAQTGTEVFTQTAGQIMARTTLFDATALALLDSVNAGTNEMFVGDDVATGLTQPLGNRAPVVMLATGTTQVQGAFRFTGGAIQGRLPTSVGMIDPPQARAYSAYEETLFALGIAGASATLTAVDTAAALLGISKQTVTNVTGDIPTAPLAMAWHAQRRILYVVDVAVEGNRKRLRLIALDASGVAHELWRTEPVQHAPDKAMLSVDAAGEWVLALMGATDHDETEVIVLDDSGRPKLSRDFEGRLLLPALAVAAGVDLPFERRDADSNAWTGLRDEMHPRAEFAAGLCGARWLRAHADATSRLLASTSCEDEHHERGEGSHLPHFGGH